MSIDRRYVVTSVCTAALGDSSVTPFHPPVFLERQRHARVAICAAKAATERHVPAVWFPLTGAVKRPAGRSGGHGGILVVLIIQYSWGGGWSLTDQHVSAAGKKKTGIFVVV